MKWIGTAGGPFVMLPRGSTKLWGGYVTSYTAAYHLTEDGSTTVTDYDRACEVSGSTGVLQLGTSECLVFGNECCQAAWVNPVDRLQGYLVRWLYADGEDMILEALSTLTDTSFDGTGIRFQNASNQLVLADSATPGRKISVENSLQIDLPVGDYIVNSILHQPHARVGLLIHRFAPL